MTNHLSILGSTGSIGVQALDVCETLGIRVTSLAAYKNSALLEAQARKFQPRQVALVDEAAAKDLKVRLADTSIRVLSGMDGVCACAADDRRMLWPEPSVIFQADSAGWQGYPA